MKKSDERLYSSPATTKICFERTINVSLSRYTQLGSAFATCLEINVFPQAGGDVTVHPISSRRISATTNIIVYWILHLKHWNTMIQFL